MTTSSNSALDMPSWSDLLETSRAKSEKNDESVSCDGSSSSSTSVMDEVERYFPLLSQQLSSYGNSLQLRRAGIETAYNETDPPEVDKDSLGPFHLRKELIMETRAALRYALSFFACEESRRNMQRKAIMEYQWHRLLCHTLSQPDGDHKCRVMSARLLSNLVTVNYDTASVLASDLALSPSQDHITARIRNSLSLDTTTTTTTITSPVSSLSSRVDHMDSGTWVDMMVACSRANSRDALGATVAALHNCLAALDDGNRSSDRQVLRFAQKIASDRLLVSTLLRQALPSDAVIVRSNQATTSHADAATEWIALTVEKLCQLGLIASVFASAGGSTQRVTPEQLVLLHCAAQVVEEAPPTRTTAEITRCHPLGGEAGDMAVLSSLCFLAQTYCDLQQAAQSTSDTDTTNDHFDFGLTASASSVLLQMLSSALAVDGVACLAQARLKIGAETRLLSDVCLKLGSMVDVLSSRNNGRTARELELSREEQLLLTGLVRLIGNLCFGCRPSQDFMRHMEVPRAGNCNSMENGAPASSSSSGSRDRTALHVLLSCTSFSTGCFTLREWAIVALRNVLEENEENQRLVEQLQAQQPVQTAELQQMGLRVDLDVRGQVRVVPTNKAAGEQH